MPLSTPHATRSLIFAVLMLASAISAFLLPRGWTDWSDGLIQPLAAVESPVSGTTRAVRDFATPRPRLSAAESERLQRENEQLRRLVGHQELLLAERGEELAAVTGIREQLGGISAQIIVARVVGGESSPLRESLLISQGSIGPRPVRVGDWVAAGAPRAARADRGGRELLLREWLIGRVAQVHPYVSRVQLTTDPGFGDALFRAVRVRAARALSDGTWQFAKSEALLYGDGGERMVIRQASESLLAERFVTVVARLSDALPVEMLIGKLTGSTSLPESALHYDFTVTPPASARTLTHVYVISLGG